MAMPQHDSKSALGLLDLAAFLFSNKFTQPGSEIGTSVYSWIKRWSNTGIIEHLLSMCMPTAEALAEQLFSVAIEKEDVSLAKRILDSGFKPNVLRCSPPSPLYHCASTSL